MSKFFPSNEHPVERVIRVVVGLVLLTLIFVGPKTWWGLVGAVPLLTGVVGSCPLYTILGWNTRSTKQSGTPATQS